MNAQSSRSHTVFSITVHIKENTVDGEELLKTGKLNLVDLAGSENVGRSGAVDRRAREAGSINQSLLTLGRVITALVEQAPHIPYRESKLTRLLQESLGGRTKTSIIATVSPGSINLEETLSTLDYAHRAKNITNRPEINKKLSKKALLKEHTEEIERLRRDLLATRERHGVHLAHENHNEMQSTIECQGKDIDEKINHIKALEETMFSKEKMFNDLQVKLEQRTIVLSETKDQLESTKNVLQSTKNCLKTTKLDRDVHKHLVEKHATTEKILYSQAQTLLKVADTATDDIYKLHDKIFRKKRVEDENENLGQQFGGNIAKSFGKLEQDLSIYSRNLVQFCLSMKDQLLNQTAVNSKGIDVTIQLSKDLVKEGRAEAEILEQKVNASHDVYKKWIEAQVSKASDMTEEQISFLLETSEKLAPRIQELCDNKIAENVRLVNEQTAKKFENMLTYIKDSTATFSETLLADHEKLLKHIVEMQDIIGTLKRAQDESTKRRNDFFQAFEGMFKHYKHFSAKEESSYSIIDDSLHRVDRTCNMIKKESGQSYTKQVQNGDGFAKELQDSVNTIKANVATDMEKNWTIAHESIEKSKVLVNEFQTGIIENCESLNAYKNLIQRNAESMQERTDTDQASVILSADRLRKIVSDASVNHVEIVEQQRHKVADGLTEIGRKFENLAVESTEWNNRITGQLRTNQHQVNEFLVEDILRDVPTGMTSPDERIIKRSRQTRKESEGSEDEQDLRLVSMDTPANVVLTEPTVSKTPVKKDRRSSRRRKNKVKEESSKIPPVQNTIDSISPNEGTLRRSPRLAQLKKPNYLEWDSTHETETDEEDDTESRYRYNDV